MADTSFDVLIIGSGPGGYIAAIRAAQLGFKTAIVERDYLGGICLNWGCVPTKALLRSAEIFHYLQHAKDYGLKADNVGFDAQAIVKRSRAVSKRLNDGVGFLMKKNKVAIIWGEAAIDAPGKVTVVEVLPQILPVEDAEIQTFARKSFEKQGIKILINAKVTKLDKKADSVTATIEEGGKQYAITAERVISAVGVVGNTENLGLEKLGVKTERGIIAVDQFNKTNVPGIYAIGDVSGPPMLAHKAEHEGVVCIEAIKGLHPHPMNKLMIPGCTYCSPQIASVGLTEQAAKDGKRDIRVGRFPFVGNGKAIALGEDQGLVKVIFDKKTGQLLGAHMVGAEVTELIQGYVVAMNLESTEEELMHTIFPHPTLSEMMKEAVLDAYGRVLNM